MTQPGKHVQPLIVWRPGQSLVLVVQSEDTDTSFAQSLICSDFGACVVSYAEQLALLEEQKRDRIGAVLLLSEDFEWCQSWIGHLRQDETLQALPWIVRGGDGLRAFEEDLLSLGAKKLVGDGVGLGPMRMLLADAIEEASRLVFLTRELASRSSAIGHIMSGEFVFRTRTEAGNLATMLSLTCGEPGTLAVGLTELLLNAVEHGLLGIGSAEKERLIEAGQFSEEVERRLADPAYTDRQVMLTFRREGDYRYFDITDPGEGFDHQTFSSRSVDGSYKKSGRGILMAKTCFDDVIYHGAGNQVTATYLCTTRQ